MKILVSKNGFYFRGSAKELLKELSSLKYESTLTVKDFIKECKKAS